MALGLRKWTPRSSVRTRRTGYALGRMCVKFVLMCVVLSDTLNNAPESLARFIPRLRREMRRRLVPWERILTKSQHEIKYTLQRDVLDTFIISLERATERKKITAKFLELQKLDYEEYHAVDGLKPLQSSHLVTYAGRKKIKRLLLTANLSNLELLKLDAKYKSGKLKDRALRLSLHERLRFGCYMSHVLVWQAMLDRGLDFIIVLEDDVTLTHDFAPKVRDIISRLPQHWGILYLNGTQRKFGGKFADGVFQSKGGVGAFAYAISRGAVNYFLDGAAMKSDKPIDHVMDEAVLSAKVLAFHAFPELASLLPNMNSTLAY